MIDYRDLCVALRAIAKTTASDYDAIICDEAAKMIEHLARPWISIKDALPDPKTEVLVVFDDGDVWSLWQDWSDPDEDDPFVYTLDPCEGTCHRVTHWMPLPPAPEVT